MAIAEPRTDIPGITRPMTYEEYVASPEEMARYDILDGWKVYRLYGDKLMPSPTRRHQTIALNLAEAFRAYQRREGNGETFIAPCDVQITYQPLRSRQPDLLFISSSRLEQNEPADEYAPLSPAPELVVEIVSPSDTPPVLSAKITDYQAADVHEVWLVRPEEQSVEVLRLPQSLSEAQKYEPGQAAVSAVFPGLSITLNDIFSQE